MVSASVASRSSALAHLVEVGDLDAACPGAPCPRSAAARRGSASSSVVLPAPFGPIRPTLSPRRIVAEKSLTIELVAEAHARRRFSSATILPLGDAGVELRAAPGRASRAAPRAARAAPRSRCDAADAARAPRLDALAHPDLFLRQQLVGARVGERLGGELLGLPAPRRRRSCRDSCAARRGRARRCAWRRASRKARSWVISTTLPRKPLSSSSSQAIESRSRWLVGSSSSSTSGTATSACASATRFLVPPESSPIARAPSRCSCAQRRLDPLLPVPGVERLDARSAARRGRRPARAPRSARARSRASATPSPTASNTDMPGVEHRLLRHVADAQALASAAAGRRRASRARR